MKNYKLICSKLSYALAIFLLGFYFYVTLNQNLLIFEIGKIILLCLVCLFLYFGAFFLSKYKNNNKSMKVNLYLFFFLYLFIFIILTLVDKNLHRNWDFIFKANDLAIKEYLKNSFNLIPFKTIIGYIKDFNLLLDSKNLIINLYGNFIVCTPFAFFLPFLFKRQKSFKTFLVTIMLIVLGIELIQFITLSGSFDVDDFILNISGSLIAYGIFKVEVINSFLKNIFLLEKNFISKKKFIQVSSIIFIGLLLSFVLVQKVAKKYYYNYEEHNRINNPKISFEYEKECSNNNLFYEDKIYKYYFKCYNEKTFYVIVNGEDKYTINNLLNNSEYKYDIDRILDKMDYENIQYYIEHKYPYYKLELETNSENISTLYNIKNEFVEVVMKKTKEKTMNDSLIFELNFIPLKEGNTIIEINFDIFDGDGKEVKNIVKKIKIDITKDLKVEFKEM